MKNFLCEKDKYIKNFADSIYNEFRKMSYGIASCKKDPTALYLDIIRKELVDYQLKSDIDANECSPKEGWMPLNYCPGCGVSTSTCNQPSGTGCSCGYQ